MTSDQWFVLAVGALSIIGFVTGAAVARFIMMRK